MRIDQVRLFVRFVLVGMFNTGVSYAVYAGLLLLGMPFAAANFGALLVGILVSFRTQGTLVFRNPDPRLLLKFVAFWLMIFLFNIGLISILVSVGLNPYWAGAFAMVPVTILSFFIQKRFVFRAPRSLPMPPAARTHP